MKRINKIYVDGENYEIYDKSAHDKINGLEIPEVDLSEYATKTELDDYESKTLKAVMVQFTLSGYSYSSFTQDEINIIEEAFNNGDKLLCYINSNYVKGNNNYQQYFIYDFGAIKKVFKSYNELCTKYILNQYGYIYVNTGVYYNEDWRRVILRVCFYYDGGWKLVYNVYGYNASSPVLSNYEINNKITSAINALEIPDTSNFATSEQLTTLANRVDDIEDSAIDSALLETMQNGINTNSTNITNLSSGIESYKNGIDLNIQDLYAQIQTLQNRILTLEGYHSGTQPTAPPATEYIQVAIWNYDTSMMNSHSFQLYTEDANNSAYVDYNNYSILSINTGYSNNVSVNVDGYCCNIGYVSSGSIYLFKYTGFGNYEHVGYYYSESEIQQYLQQYGGGGGTTQSKNVSLMFYNDNPQDVQISVSDNMMYDSNNCPTVTSKSYNAISFNYNGSNGYFYAQGSDLMMPIQYRNIGEYIDSANEGQTLLFKFNYDGIAFVGNYDNNDAAASVIGGESFDAVDIIPNNEFRCYWTTLALYNASEEPLWIKTGVTAEENGVIEAGQYEVRKIYYAWKDGGNATQMSVEVAQNTDSYMPSNTKYYTISFATANMTDGNCRILKFDYANGGVLDSSTFSLPNENLDNEIASRISSSEFINLTIPYCGIRLTATGTNTYINYPTVDTAFSYFDEQGTPHDETLSNAVNQLPNMYNGYNIKFGDNVMDISNMNMYSNNLIIKFGSEEDGYFNYVMGYDSNDFGTDKTLFILKNTPDMMMFGIDYSNHATQRVITDNSDELAVMLPYEPAQLYTASMSSQNGYINVSDCTLVSDYNTTDFSIKVYYYDMQGQYHNV